MILSPGATIGILGAGQLGRMLAMAALKVGLRTHIFAPEADAPGLRRGGGADGRRLRRRGGARPLRRGRRRRHLRVRERADGDGRISRQARGRPAGRRALALTQDRLTEKTFLRDLGLKTAPFVGVEDAGALVRAVAELGRPSILKTRRFGYDGKGQSLIREGSNVAAVHRTLGPGADDPRRLRRLRARGVGGRRAQPRRRDRRLRPLRERARAPHPGPHPRAGAGQPGDGGRGQAHRRPRCSTRSTMSACWRSRCSSPATGTAARGSSSTRSRRASTIPATGRSRARRPRSSSSISAPSPAGRSARRRGAAGSRCTI